MNNLGCSFLEDGIDFEQDKICDCCISHNDGRGLPVLIEDYHGDLINWEELFNKKAERISRQKECTIYDCEGCYRLMEYDFKNERKISEFHFSHCRSCNAKCIYCSTDFSEGSVNYDTYPVVKDLIDKGYYKPGGEATFQGGEPTVMRNFDNLVQLLSENGTLIRVHSSGIRHSQTVENALKDDKGTVVISIDSGSGETYKKIKLVDKFDEVCNTIQKYAQANANNVIIKYIIVPGYNDNIKEIDKFFELIKKYNIKTVALDIEVRYAREYENKNVSPHVYLLVDYFEKLAADNKIKMLTYSFLSYVLQNRTIKKSNLIGNKFLYGFCINKNKDKTKNLTYKR